MLSLFRVGIGKTIGIAFPCKGADQAADMMKYHGTSFPGNTYFCGKKHQPRLALYSTRWRR